MQILHIVHKYPPGHIGGTEIYTQTLAAWQRTRGHETAIFTRRMGDGRKLDEADLNGTQIFTAVTKAGKAEETFMATFGNAFLEQSFAEVLDRVSPDLVHIQHLMGFPAAMVQQVNRRRIPVVTTLHDYWWLCANAQLFTNYDDSVCQGPQLFLNCARCAIARMENQALNLAIPIIAGLMGWRARLVRRAMRHVDTFIAPTRFVQELFARSGHLQADRLVYAPHGIDTEGVQSHQPRPAGGPLRIAYLGGISQQKGVTVLVQAVKQLPPGKASLVVMGDLQSMPDYTQQLQRQIFDCPNITLAGRSTRDEVWETLAKTDLLVVPSLWYEAASLVVQEAFAAGVPVVGSRLGALEERIRDGVDGFLFNPGDSQELASLLSRLADDDQELEKLRGNIQPVLSIGEHVDQLLELYHELIAPRDQER